MYNLHVEARQVGHCTDGISRIGKSALLNTLVNKVDLQLWYAFRIGFITWPEPDGRQSAGTIDSVAGSRPELFSDRKTRHDGLERMLVDIGPSVRVIDNLVLQPVDVPKLGRRGVRIE